MRARARATNAQPAAVATISSASASGTSLPKVFTPSTNATIVSIERISPSRSS
jgi:hypothetical protein